VDWTFVYLMFALKVPIIGAIWIVWWAVRQEPDPLTDGRDDGGNPLRRACARRSRGRERSSASLRDRSS
jgi:hypothetical protein